MSDYEIPARYSDTTLRRARVLLKDERVERVNDTTAKVRGSEVYEVRALSPNQVTCGCPNGRNRGGEPTCYHSLAALLLLEPEPETASVAVENEPETRRYAQPRPSTSSDDLSALQGDSSPAVIYWQEFEGALATFVEAMRNVTERFVKFTEDVHKAREEMGGVEAFDEFDAVEDDL